MWRRTLVAPLVTAALALTFASGPATSPAFAAPESPIQVSSLTTDGVNQPLGDDKANPAFSWELSSQVNGSVQSAYQVRVASGAGALASGTPDVWDSGKVASDQSVGIDYAGPALQPGHRYYWAVRVWDGNGQPSAWSTPTWWETGLMGKQGWNGAQWITPQSTPEWTNYTVDVDFTILTGDDGVIFDAQDSNNYYMWQVNSEVSPGTVLLRPHVHQNGGWNVLPAVPLNGVIDTGNLHATHHMQISQSGDTITTTIDGTLVSTVHDATYTSGSVGFRSGDNTEDATYDNLAVRDSSGKTLFADDFSTSPDPSFPGANIHNGVLETANGAVVIAQQGQTSGAPMLRKTFDLTGQIQSARASVIGLGWYELHLNGQKVGDHVLAPANTPYSSELLYDSYDVTRMLHPGTNAAGILLGSGYGPTYSQYGFRWMGPLEALVKIDVTYAGGTHDVIVSDGTWTWSTGPIVADDIYDGETYDATKVKTGWDTPGYDASGWQPVHPGKDPGGTLTGDLMPPERVVQTVRPVSLTEPKPGVFVYDLGQNIAGWAQLHVSGPRGTTVQMHYAEDLAADGTLDTYTNRNAKAVDSYTLAGAGTETYEPRFTYHGFRYVEVTGYPGTPTLDSISGRVVHADVAPTGQFNSSDPTLNQIHSNNVWTMLNNTMSIPTDNPVRDERTPAGMDLQAHDTAEARDFDMNAYDHQLLPEFLSGGGSPDMSGAAIPFTWDLYEQYGDRSAVSDYYPQLKAYLAAVASAAPNGIWTSDLGGFGDWCPPAPASEANGGQGGQNVGGYNECFSEIPIVNTALFYRDATIMTDLARAFGHDADAQTFDALAQKIKTAFNDTFLNAAGNGYGDGRQTTSILPLAFGLVPSSNLHAVGQQLVDTIETTNSGHLDTGIFGTRYLIDALVAAGRPDVAISMLDQRTYPGFGYEISRGATTDWEEWPYLTSMESHDHAMFGGIDASMYNALGGITPTAPGYARFDVRPAVPAHGLDQIDASEQTVRGLVSSQWWRTGNALHMTVEVPVNSTADVYVPIGAGQSNAVSNAANGARFLRDDNGYAVFEAGSGTYRFVSPQYFPTAGS